MDCVFGPMWLHSLDWSHHIGNTATGTLQVASSGMAESFGIVMSCLAQ